MEQPEGTLSSPIVVVLGPMLRRRCGSCPERRSGSGMGEGEEEGEEERPPSKPLEMHLTETWTQQFDGVETKGETQQMTNET